MTLLQQLTSILKPEALLPDDQLGRYAIDGVAPRLAVRPDTRQDIAQVLKWAASKGVAVFPVGGSTQLSLGNVPARFDLAMDMTAHNRLLDHQPADLTATVEAGMPLAALQRELARRGQLVALEAPLAEQATVGGVLAAGASGPLRYAYGLPRDWLIGISIISPDGVETKAGGKVVKNVTGYDLNKLYTGSLGTLGVIIEATFKLVPLPADSGMLLAAFSSTNQAVDAARYLLKAVVAPQGLQVVDALAARQLGILPDMLPGNAFAICFYAGRSRAVQRKLSESITLLRDKGANQAARLDHDEGNALLRRVTDLGWIRKTTPYLGLKITVAPAQVDRVVAQAGKDTSLGFLPGIMADVGFGRVQLYWWPPETDEGLDETRAHSAITHFRGVVRELGGSVVVEHCPLTLKRQLDVWGHIDAAGIQVMQRIKEKLDPFNVLNPGRFIGRI